jgi:chromosome segregation ATPase
MGEPQSNAPVAQIDWEKRCERFERELAEALAEVERLKADRPRMIDALGEMTERCYKAEEERDHLREIAQQRWEERNAAREVAREIRLMWMGEDAKASAGAYEDLADLEQRFYWLDED